MMSRIRNLIAAFYEMVEHWLPVSGEARTFFRPMPWELDRNGNLRPHVALQMAALAERGWLAAAGFGSGRANGAVVELVEGDAAGFGRFLAFERLVVSTALVGQAEDHWTLDHCITSEDGSACLTFRTCCRLTETARWSLFTPKAPAAISIPDQKAEETPRKAA